MLRRRHLKHAPDAARENDVEVAAEPENGVGNRRRDNFNAIAVLLPRRLGAAVILLEAALGKAARLAWAAVLRQNIGANPFDERSKRRLVGFGFEGLAGTHTERSEVEREHGESWMSDRPVVEKRPQATRYTRK